eukprot:5421852-Pyramimonas_sp.AAC.1
MASHQYDKYCASCFWERCVFLSDPVLSARVPALGISAKFFGTDEIASRIVPEEETMAVPLFAS